MKNMLKGIKSKLEGAEEQILDLEGRVIAMKLNTKYKK